jgi:glycosyltransferase involved in cell wall biosynthesis
MKVLFNHNHPFRFVDGGAQAMIEQMRLALLQAGVEVEWLRWWDRSQGGDIVHQFGRPTASFVAEAQRSGFRVVVTDLLGKTGARPRWQLAAMKLFARLARRARIERRLDRVGWGGILERADAVLASTEWEAQLMRDIFGVARGKVHVVGEAVQDVYLNLQPLPRGPWLVSTGTIHAIKRTVEVAEAALLAKTPLWVIGRPHGQGDAYSERFLKLAREHPDQIRYEGFVPLERLVQAYREARGFVLLSQYETMSIAALEAAACECPLLLSDMPWARVTWGDQASYCPPRASTSTTAGILRRFYDAAPNLPRPPRPISRAEVARRWKAIYESLLAGK